MIYQYKVRNRLVLLIVDACNTLLSNNLGLVIWLNMWINIQGPSLRNLFSELICIDQLQIFSNTEIIKVSRWFCRHCFLSDHKAECLYKPESNFSDFVDIVFRQTIKLNVFINLKPIFPSLLLLFKFYWLINITNFWSHLLFWKFSPLFVFIPRWYSPFWFCYKYCYQRKFETLIIISVNNSLNNLVMLKSLMLTSLQIQAYRETVVIY